MHATLLTRFLITPILHISLLQGCLVCSEAHTYDLHVFTQGDTSLTYLPMCLLTKHFSTDVIALTMFAVYPGLAQVSLFMIALLLSCLV